MCKQTWPPSYQHDVMHDATFLIDEIQRTKTFLLEISYEMTISNILGDQKQDNFVLDQLFIRKYVSLKKAISSADRIGSRDSREDRD